MAKRKGFKNAVKKVKKINKTKQTRLKPEVVGSTGLHIRCTDECGATTEMFFSGEVPYSQAKLTGQGWAVLNSPEDNTIAFLCPECFRKLEPEDVVEHDADGLIDVHDPDDDDDGEV
jgi:hypothetical protein